MQRLINRIYGTSQSDLPKATLNAHIQIQKGAVAARAWVVLFKQFSFVPIKASPFIFLLLTACPVLPMSPFKEEEEAAKAENEEKTVDPNGDEVRETAAKHIIEYIFLFISQLSLFLFLNLFNRQDRYICTYIFQPSNVQVGQAGCG